MQSRFLAIALLGLIASGFNVTARAANERKNPPESAAKKDIRPYDRADIETSRFSTVEHRALLQKAFGLEAAINQEIVGQEHLAAAFQQRFIQYLDTFGRRQGEPIAANLIGVPGVGKSAILKVLRGLGITILAVDAQEFLAGDNPDLVRGRLVWRIRDAVRRNQGRPMILLIDELDKTPEILPDRSESQPLIGAVNQILVDGKLSASYEQEPVDLSNVMFVTAMNLSPADIGAFSRDVLGDEHKSYWDYSEDDLRKLDGALRPKNGSPALLAKMLARFFRDNTISRLIPDALVAKPLYGKDFDRLIDLDIKRAGQRFGGDGREVHIATTAAFNEFLRGVAVFAPSGARMNVKVAGQLVEQLMSFAIRSKSVVAAGGADRPLFVTMDYDKNANASILHVDVLARRGRETLTTATAQMRLRYFSEQRAFETPIDLISSPPVSDRAATLRTRKVSGRAIEASRFPSWKGVAKQLEKTLNGVVYGQPEIIKGVSESIAAYLADRTSEDSNHNEVLAGFTGIGKTMLFEQAAQALDMDLIAINMQEYGDISGETAQRFKEDLLRRVAAQKQERPGKPYIVLLEELDKLYEIVRASPPVNRPILAVVRDLLTHHQKTFVTSGAGSRIETIDIRDGFLAVTLNFPPGLFEFSPDPRLTTHRDMMDAYEELTSSPVALRKALAKLFRDDTINRLLASGLRVSKPLAADDYVAIMNDEIERFDATRLREGDRRTSGIDLKLTPSYRNDYLISESVIPSEGGRQAAGSFSDLLTADVNAAIDAIPRSAEFAKRPIRLELDFKSESARKPSRVIATARWTDQRGLPRQNRILERPSDLRFPPPAAFGQLDDRRVAVSAHEYGHALAATLLGFRWEYLTVQDPQRSFVKPSPHQKDARNLVAKIAILLASRAMERLVLSDSPGAAESVFDLTLFSSKDVADATSSLYTAIYQLGLAPGGGTIERSGLADEDYNKRPLFFAEVPADQVDKLGLVLRRMESVILNRFIEFRPLKWHAERIHEIARRGRLTEAEFYQLVDMPYPGPVGSVGNYLPRLREIFAPALQAVDARLQRAREDRDGRNGQTAAEILTSVVDDFSTALREEGVGKQEMFESLPVALTPSRCTDIFVVH